MTSYFIVLIVLAIIAQTAFEWLWAKRATERAAHAATALAITNARRDATLNEILISNSRIKISLLAALKSNTILAHRVAELTGDENDVEVAKTVQELSAEYETK